MITEYEGKLISTEEADTFREYDTQLLNLKQPMMYSTHIISLGRHQKIKGLSDVHAAKMRGAASFVNDPRRSNMYNAKLVQVFDQKQGRSRVWLKAITEIIVGNSVNGVELYADYHGTFWGFENGNIFTPNKKSKEMRELPDKDECDEYL